MKTVIIYDSYFGNTEKIARTIGEGCGSDVRVLKAAEASEKDIAAASLLIVGSPTRGFRPTEGVTAFISSLSPDALREKYTAVFDTRIDVANSKQPILRLFGRVFRYAAPALAKGLEDKGGKLIAEPEGFYVNDTEGPLREGEVERAKGWGMTLIKIAGSPE